MKKKNYTINNFKLLNTLIKLEIQAKNVHKNIYRIFFSKPLTVEWDLMEAKLPILDSVGVAGSTVFLPNGEGDLLFLSGTGSGSGSSSTFDGGVTCLDFLALPSFFFSTLSFFLSFFLTWLSSSFSVDFWSCAFFSSFSCLLLSSVNFDIKLRDS